MHEHGSFKRRSSSNVGTKTVHRRMFVRGRALHLGIGATARRDLPLLDVPQHSGAPALAFVHFKLEDFTWTQGAPARYRSSEIADRGFCQVCGSTLSMHERVLADRVQIAVGSLDEPHRVRIDDHVWTEQQIPWFEVADSLPRHARSSSAVPSEASRI